MAIIWDASKTHISTSYRGFYCGVYNTLSVEGGFTPTYGRSINI